MFGLVDCYSKLRPIGSQRRLCSKRGLQLRLAVTALSDDAIGMQKGTKVQPLTWRSIDQLAQTKSLTE